MTWRYCSRCGRPTSAKSGICRECHRRGIRSAWAVLVARGRTVVRARQLGLRVIRGDGET